MSFALDKKFLDNVEVGILVYDKDGWVQFVNATHLRQSYYTYEEFQHFNTYEAYRTRVSNVCLFDQVIKTKQPATAIQHTYHGRENTNYEKLVTAVPIFDEYGNVTNVVSTFIDLDTFQKKYAAARLGGEYTYDLSAAKKAENKMVYASETMQKLLDMLKVVAETDVPILLTGESGTGKEVLANFIHASSPRRESEMVIVDCASLPEHLLEAELFGYEKGAFTGASASGKAGLIETADGGTLFLDEINSMPLALQGKLLRVLETQQVKRIGALKGKTIDFRVVAATNASLPECIQKGTFRADLYYRLNVMPVNIPPLRERTEDIVPLCRHFLTSAYKKYGKLRTLSPKAYQALEQYSWPGNVRELKNFIERLVISSSDMAEEIHTIPPELLGNFEESAEERRMGKYAGRPLSGAERSELERIVLALRRCQGNRSRAAELLGISRRTMQYKLKKYRIKVRVETEVYIDS